MNRRGFIKGVLAAVAAVNLPSPERLPRIEDEPRKDYVVGDYVSYIRDNIRGPHLAMKKKIEDSILYGLGI